MHDPVETFEVNGFTVEIHNDSDPANPRKEYDHVGTMVCDHRLYDLGDKKGSPEDIPDDAICLPLYLYDHGGITMSTSPFSCPWDSGQVGVIYCTKEKAIKEWGKKRFTKKVEERAIKYLVGEVEEYDAYISGEVYGYIVKDEDGIEIDSCWGYYGKKYAVEEGKEAAMHSSPVLDYSI